jgi:hypothetical protein
MGTEGWGVVAIGAFMAFLANVLYQLGGISGKWKRRYVASFVLALAANVVGILTQNWHWQYILMYPILCAGFSLGYGGGDDTVLKIIRRAVYAAGVLMSCMCGVWAAWFSGSAWLVFGIAAVCGITSILLGVFNPFRSARAEEFLVCQVLTMFIPFWAFVR